MNQQVARNQAQNKENRKGDTGRFERHSYGLSFLREVMDILPIRYCVGYQRGNDAERATDEEGGDDFSVQPGNLLSETFLTPTMTTRHRSPACGTTSLKKHNQGMQSHSFSQIQRQIYSARLGGVSLRRTLVRTIATIWIAADYDFQLRKARQNIY